jgi:hypothetical protein
MNVSKVKHNAVHTSGFHQKDQEYHYVYVHWENSMAVENRKQWGDAISKGCYLSKPKYTLE